MHKGRLRMIDLKYCTRLSNEEVADLVFLAMKNAVEQCTTMTIVHKNLTILTGDTSPTGFTSCLLLDESHFTAHSYHDEGLLCCDIFTCGSTHLDLLTSYFINDLERIFDLIELRKCDEVTRFPSWK